MEVMVAESGKLSEMGVIGPCADSSQVVVFHPQRQGGRGYCKGQQSQSSDQMSDLFRPMGLAS